MGFLNKIFSKKDDVVEEKKTVILSLDELRTKVNISLKRVVEVGENSYSKPVFKKLLKIKGLINQLMSRDFGEDYNKALIIGANNARNRVHDQIVPLLDINEPLDLLGINSFVDNASRLLARAHKVFIKADQAKILFRDDMNDLSSAFEDLSKGVEQLKGAVSDRNEQLASFELIVRDINNLRQSIQELNDIKDNELKLRKKIQSCVDDKDFLLSEIAKMKEVEVFDAYDANMAELNKIKKKKLSLEVLVRNIVSKFSRAFKKAFKQEPFVEALLENPLEFISEHEAEYNEKIALLKTMIENDTISFGDKTKEKYLKVLGDDDISDYLASYRELTASESDYVIEDNDLINQVRAFERRVLKLNQEKAKLREEHKLLKTDLFSQEGTVDALKAKVEAGASKGYSQKVRINS